MSSGCRGRTIQGPEIAGTTFGLVLAEIRTCGGEPSCPDLPVDQALDQIIAWIEEEPAISVLERQQVRSPSTDPPPEAPPAPGRGC